MPQGLIALTGGSEGPIDLRSPKATPSSPAQRIEALKAIFGDRLYVELQRHGLAQERSVEPALLDLAYDLDLPIVATNEPYFATHEDFEAHDALICIAEGSYVAVDDRRRLSPEHYFKTAAKMRELFADLPEALDNTIEIARRCAYRPMEREPILPPFLADAAATSARGEIEAAELRRQSEAGLKERIAQHGLATGYDAEAYEKRLAIRARCHHRDELSGLFPDRRRLHQMGQGARASPSARAAAQAPARSSPMPSPSPISTRCVSGSCSSAFSIPSACRCRTSTSISARTGATR